MYTNKDTLPQTRDRLAELNARNIGHGSMLNTSEFVNFGIIPVFSEPFDDARHNVNQIDHTSAVGRRSGEPQVTHKFGLVPLKVEIASAEIADKDLSLIASQKQKATNAIADLIENSLPGFGDHVVRRGVVSAEELLNGGEPDADLRILIGCPAVIAAGVMLEANDRPTIIIGSTHRFEVGQLPADLGKVQLAAGMKPINTDDPKALKAYNTDREDDHLLDIRRLEQKDFVVVSAVIDPANKGENTKDGLYVPGLDVDLSAAVQTVTSRQR